MSVNNEPHQGWDVKAETEDDKSASNTVADSKKKRSWKKPKDKPMRPLSAYNMFFQNQRERIVAGKTGDPTPEEIHQSVMKMLTSKTRGPKRRQDRVSHGQISFGDLARTIAAKWKAIDPKLKAVYNHYAAQEKARYKKEVVIWKEKKEREHDAARAAKQRNLLTSSSSYNDSMMSLSSSVTSTLSTSMSTNYNLSESHNSIQAGLMPEIDVVQRQQDILRQQMGFIDNKQQGRMDGNDQQDSNNSGDMQYPRSMGGLGNSNAMAMNMNFNMNMNHNDAMQKEQLLLQLQQRQLRQLQQLQQVRNETSRLSNMKTTDTFLGMGGNQFGNLTSATPKHLMEQYRQLDDISQELERLKEQERQMQYKIQEHQNHTNSGFLSDNGSFGNAFNGPQSVAGVNYNEYTASLNDAVFDSEDRQRSVRRSKSGDTDLLRNRAIGLNQMNDSLLMQRRRHSASGNGVNSAPSSYNFANKFGGLQGMGGGNQQQLAQSHGRRDSLAALLQIDDMRDQQRQQQQQSQQNSLAEMLQMQGNSGGNQDTMGSLFNAN